jgi:hypothetical protein
MIVLSNYKRPLLTNLNLSGEQKQMKKLILLIVLFLSLLAINSERANAQKTLRLNSTPKAFQTFYAKFRKAVVKGDKKTVASLTQFPFKYGFDAGDEGTFSKSQFMKRFDDIFGSERKIFAQKNPVFYSEKAETYTLEDDWDASNFIFEKRGTSYKFTAYVAEP